MELPVILIVLAAAAVPWLFARNGGRRGARVSTAVVVAFLAGLPVLFWAWCWLEACGQGIILVVPMVPAAAVACLVVAVSGTLAAKTWPDGANRGRSADRE